MKDLIILSQAPLTPQIKRNNYVDEYLNVGYKIQFWDISQLLHPGVKYNDELSASYQKRIFSLFELEDNLKKVDAFNTIFILDFDAYWSNRRIFKLLSDYHCCTIRIDMYANTSLAMTYRQKISKLFSTCFKNIALTKLGLLFYKFYALIHHISLCQFYYSSSSIVNRTHKINHPDYEEFVFTDSKPVVEGKYILFVDTFFGAHPDELFIYKSKKTFSITKYQKILDDFFTYLEHQYEMPVVIAAHPKSDYSNGEFGNRRIIKYRTKDLIVHADKVVMQLCNTISWVALADKSFAFVTTDDYVALSHRKKRFDALASLFGKSIYNIEHCDFSEVLFTKVLQEIRSHYIYTYLTDIEIEKKRNIDILKESYESISLPFCK